MGCGTTASKKSGRGLLSSFKCRRTKMPTIVSARESMDILQFFMSHRLGSAPQHSWKPYRPVSVADRKQDLTPKDGERYTTALSDLKSFIHHFQMPESHISSTIVIMPASRKNAKRSTTSPYGLYTKPLRIRQQEEPLSAPSTSTSISTSASPSAPEILPLQASTSLLPHGILPVCYLSLESCIAATNNCSGHGTAYKKSGGEIDCFACKCSKTQLTDDEGRVKTVYWGGPACQKKDISVPFFLLAGLTIVLVAAVTWSVGLLFSIGEEELPSVIGAGGRCSPSNYFLIGNVIRVVRHVSGVNAPQKCLMTQNLVFKKKC